ncbi:MAG: hypothetical protein JWQ71_1281 [Pedosphaera sp.]|nr:hypothetical protein [Pedosphaera sp.]
MPRRDPKIIAEALNGLTVFLSGFGELEQARIARFHEFIRRFQEERFSKELLAEMQSFKDEVYVKLRKQIWAGQFLPGKNQDETMDEFHQAFGAVGSAIYPPEPKPPEMDLSDWPKASQLTDKKVRYTGDPAGVRPIIERSLSLLEQYCPMVGRGDFTAAYQLTGAGLRAWMTPKKFISAHNQAAKEYGGQPAEFLIERFVWVLADDAARKKSTADEGWPKLTTKEVRRCCVTGFWICDKTDRTGCAGSFLITEEENEYRIVKFGFYRP